MRLMRRLIAATALLCVTLVLLEAPVTALSLRGTQSLLVEYDSRGMAVMGTLVVDMALTPAWSLTYIHDRNWTPHGRDQIHDVSVTRVLPKDRTVTLGWRVKVPEDGDSISTGYVLVAWRWGE